MTSNKEDTKTNITTTTTTTPTLKNPDEIIVKYRESLPSAMFDRSSVSIWSVLKNCIGKELYKFTIPIIWNEPLSLLQRTAENIKFSDHLLDKAATMQDPVERMKCVAGHLISCTSINVVRLSKPFNPLLGETFEFVDPERKYRICCEQVSHHPPITAFYSESLKLTGKQQPIWKYYGSLNPVLKLNFMNACVEAYPEGVQTIELPEFGETYTWYPPKIFAHNLVIGKLWFEFHGKVEIINHKHKLRCDLDFIPYSWFSKGMYRVAGYILNSDDERLAVVGGKWDEYFYATQDTDKDAVDFVKQLEKLPENQQQQQQQQQTPSKSKHSSKSHHHKHQHEHELIWRLDAESGSVAKSLVEYYGFTKFTLSLNQLLDEHQQATSLDFKSSPSTSSPVSIGPIAPTDCRFRTDLRLYESGDLDRATMEKERLEEKQRERRRLVEAGEQDELKPIWFDRRKHPLVNDEETWIFNSKYWQRDFQSCPNIF